MSQLWQHPYVNVFKHYNIQSWKNSSKEGEVTTEMDRTLKCTVHRITGSIPANNFLQLPKTSTQSLALTGSFFYLLFRPLPGGYFVVHLHTTTQDGLVVRISFSNLFKEFKSTSTWLQFPFVCNPTDGGRVHSGPGDESFPTPLSACWTVLCLDLRHILSLFLSKQYMCVKSVRLCANMLVKNIFTSDTLYEPGLSLDEVKRGGVSSQNMNPMPREMSFHLSKGHKWNDVYHKIKFPSKEEKHFVAKHGKLSMKSTKSNGARSVVVKTSSLSEAATDSDSAPRHAVGSSSLPLVGVEGGKSVGTGVHIYAHQPPATQGVGDSSLVHSSRSQSAPTCDSPKPAVPDPILTLQRIVGFGGQTTAHALWSSDGLSLVYPCHALIVSMFTHNGQQRFFIGHTDKVSCLALNGNSTLLASGQTGPHSVVRVWQYETTQCVAVFKTHAHSLACLSLSHSGSVLCGVGKDTHSRNLVVVWDLERAVAGGEVKVVAKASTDVDIVRMRLASFDDTRLVSCGRDNVRVWRVKGGSVRSAPVDLGPHHSMLFTDCCFEAGHDLGADPLRRLIFACSESGHIFEIDYQKVCVKNVRRLLPVSSAGPKHSTPTGISVSCMAVNEAFCVTGSSDGYLRLWPLDFKQVYLEAEHEGPVTAADISPDGMKIAAATAASNVGVLDVSTRAYTTLMRSHTSHVISASLHPLTCHLATVSHDSSIRIWDVSSMQQLFEFTGSGEAVACTVVFHPVEQVFACGFSAGAVRVFSVASTCLLAQHKAHREAVTGLAFSVSGSYLYSAGREGSLALYDATDAQYPLLRALPGLLAPGTRGITANPDGQTVAFVGPTEFTVSVVNCRTLDEVLRLDISSVHPPHVDSALSVLYSPHSHLLVTTSAHRLLKFDNASGRLLAQLDIQGACSALAVSHDGRLLAAATGKVLRVWDYDMRGDPQVFIGHSEAISQLLFTPDNLSLLSTGDAVLTWGIRRRRRPSDELKRDSLLNKVNKHRTITEHQSPTGSGDAPRPRAPQPTSQSPPTRLTAQREDSGQVLNERSRVSTPEVIKMADMSLRDEQPVSPSTLSTNTISPARLSDHMTSHGRKSGHVTSSKWTASKSMQRTTNDAPIPPSVHRHFKARPKKHGLAQRRYAAPQDQAGLRLQAVIGYNGNGRGNMAWNAESGTFVYTSGCVIVVEDLGGGRQRHLLGHNEEISTLALQHQSQVLASASCSSALSPSQLCVWDLSTMSLTTTLSHSHHHHHVVSMAFSHDDSLLLTASDYRESRVVVWNVHTGAVLCSAHTPLPIHALAWEPASNTEFCSVGESGSLLFWLIEHTTDGAMLYYHQPDVPSDLSKGHFTALCYAPHHTVYVANSLGQVSSWDTTHNTCSLHWQAHDGEIGVLEAAGGRLVTGGASCLRVWLVEGTGPVVMEDEMAVSGAVVSAAFDATLDMGIVGTDRGSLWYINWPERSSVRLVGGHDSQVRDVAVHEQYVVTACQDGGVRVWSDGEQTLQFQVQDQSCNCVCLAARASTQPSAPSSAPSSAPAPAELPWLVAGYSDGTVRLFDLTSVQMTLKMQPHACPVTALTCSPHGDVVLSGGEDGLVAVSNTTTGITTRLITDHQGATITGLDTTLLKDAGQLWLAVSADRRVSVWSAHWARDVCDLVDWLSFPAPAFGPDGDTQSCDVPPCVAKFSVEEPDTVVYTGYGMDRQLLFYSLAQRRVLRSLPLTHWASSMDLSPTTPLIVVANNERLLTLMDYYEGSFQDFTAHDDAVHCVRFSPDGRTLLSVSHTALFIWTVTV